MSYENKGIISKNARKTDEKHPDISGSINVDGKEYWLSGWAKKNDKGSYYSLSIKPKEAKQEKKAEPKNDEPPFNDEIPF